MRSFAAGVCVAVFWVGFSGSAGAGDRGLSQADVDAGVRRGLDFLVKDAKAWREEHNCVSCHHAALVVWSMREADRRGIEVDRPALDGLTAWLAESGDGRTGAPRPKGVPKALNTKAVYFALGLGADPDPSPAVKAGLGRLLKTVEEDQTEDGSWAAWPETRPPMFGPSDESMTALAALALSPAAEAGDPAARAVLDKAVRRLDATKTDGDPQSLALRLVLWRRLKRPNAEWFPLVDRIEARQNADGGWSQAEGMPSDAWATGQALYALAWAGVPPVEPPVARAQSFLLKTQRPDGSWPMTSRPIKPGGPGAKNLVPITGAAAAWAVMGLARSR